MIAAGAVILGAILVSSGSIDLALDTTPAAIARGAMLAAIVVLILGVGRYGGEGFLAALWVFAPLVPIIAAVVSVVTYLLSPVDESAVVTEPIQSVYAGTAIALLGWFLSGFPGAPLACRERAQERVYNDLVQRYEVLAARAVVERQKCGAVVSKALFEAEHCLATVRDTLYGDDCGGPGLRWATSSGYTGLTRQLHRAEEALFAVESVPELIGDVLHDDLSLEDSGLRNRFALRRVIRDALPVISQAAADALLRPVPALPPASRLIETPADGGHDVAAGGGQQVVRLKPDEAREALREVRFAINDFRDDILDSFARGRNRLIWTYLAVSLTTYALVGLGLLAGIPKLTLVSVSVIYLVASLVGLFNRLRIESSATPRLDDYGLYFARLLTGPLLSGLAGVAGVYLIAQAPAFLGPLTAGGGTAAASPAPGALPSPSPDAVASSVAQASVVAAKPLSEIYDLSTNQLALLVAAIFGLAPGLLTSRLQQQVDRLERDFARSEPATSTSSTGGDTTSEDDAG